MNKRALVVSHWSFIDLMIQANQSAAVLQEEPGIGPITNENLEYENAVLFGTLKMANALVDSIISPSLCFIHDALC